jgi:hypothetical protein
MVTVSTTGNTTMVTTTLPPPIPLPLTLLPLILSQPPLTNQPLANSNNKLMYDLKWVVDHHRDTLNNWIGDRSYVLSSDWLHLNFECLISLPFGDDVICWSGVMSPQAHPLQKKNNKFNDISNGFKTQLPSILIIHLVKKNNTCSKNSLRPQLSLCIEI